MKLQLTRPLVFFDLEATGVNRETDRIVEISILKIFPDGNREIKTRRINPGIPIPKGATDIHGITDEDVADEPTFENLAVGLMSFIKECDFAGFNSNSYDIPLLFNHFNAAGIYWDYSQFRMIDAGNIFKRKESRTLTAAYKFYCDKDLEGAHGAEQDILATAEVFFAQLEKYDDIPTDLDELQLYCNYDKRILDLSGKFTLDEEGDIIFNFGSKKGIKAKTDLPFVNWMLGKDFAEDTKRICMQLVGEFGPF